MPLSLGTTYTREQIHQEVGGGDLTSYLPHRHGNVVCGCFDPEFNQCAPTEIDLGAGVDVQHYAQQLRDQGTAVPVFLKRATDQWQYSGRFRAVRYGTDPADLTQGPPRRVGTVAVLYLVEEQVGGEVTNDPSISIEAAAEGGLALANHLQRERSRYLSDAKRRAYRVAHGTLSCEACGLSESALPLTIGEGCFEVHHTEPLADREASSLTRIADLALLCANCHGMVHRARPMLAVSALANLLSRLP